SMLFGWNCESSSFCLPAPSGDFTCVARPAGIAPAAVAATAVSSHRLRFISLIARLRSFSCPLLGFFLLLLSISFTFDCQSGIKSPAGNEIAPAARRRIMTRLICVLVWILATVHSAPAQQTDEEYFADVSVQSRRAPRDFAPDANLAKK